MYSFDANVDKYSEEELKKMLRLPKELLEKSEEDLTPEEKLKIDEALLEQKLKIGFGVRLKKLRQDRFLTQKAFSKEIGYKPPVWCKYEATNGVFPSIGRLVKIAEYFNVSIDYLLLGITNSPTAIESSTSVSNSFIQSNVQADNGSVVVNGHILSDEMVVELLKVYEKLDVRDRVKLLDFGFKLDEQTKPTRD